VIGKRLKNQRNSWSLVYKYEEFFLILCDVSSSAHVPDLFVPCYCTMQRAAIELDSELTPKPTEICIFLQVNARTPPVL
jgi:hypothetical protein